MRPVLVLMALSLVACVRSGRAPDADIPAAPDAAARGRDAGDAARDAPPDTGNPYCHYDCFRGFRCLDGVVDEITHAPVPCERWTGECPHGPAGVECERGCREGAYADRPEDVCEENVPKDEGDPCTTDEECTPGRQVPDGFGGTVELALHCDLGTATCARTVVEACDGVDDDADGTVDEGCACRPRVVAAGAPGSYASAASFGPDRVAILEGRDADVRLSVVGLDGTALGAPHAVLSARQVERVSGAFAVLRHNSLAPPDQIVVVGDDGATRTTSLAGSPTTRGAAFAPLGTDWLLVGIDGSSSHSLQLHDGVTGARRAVGALPITMPGGLRFVGRPADLAVFSGPIAAPIEAFAIDAALGVRPLGSASRDRSGFLAQPAVIGGRIFMVVASEFELVVAVLDASDAWSSHPIPTVASSSVLPVIAAAGTGVAISWVDSTDVLRTILLDETFARVGASSVPVGASVTGGLWAGGTDAGPRVVVGRDDHWSVVAPCDVP